MEVFLIFLINLFTIIFFLEYKSYDKENILIRMIKRFEDVKI